MLVGLIEPTGGRCFIDGVDVRESLFE